MARARLDRQAQGVLHLEHVLPYLLHGGHLTPEERLVCFRSSKGMAELVVRHASRTCLTLALAGGTAVAASSGAGSSRQLAPRHAVRTRPAPVSWGTRAAAAAAAAGSSMGSSRHTRAHAKAAQQLAAPSDNVKLVLTGGLLSPAACLRQRITAMELCNIQLDQTSTSQLQLHRLPCLHTLSLRDCKVAPARTTSGITSNSSSRQQKRSTSVHTLEWLVSAPTEVTYNSALMTQEMYESLTHVFPYAACELVDPSQVQTVISNHASVTDHLPLLPALQQLHILPAAEAKNSKVYDHEFEQLLAHPRLARVQLADVEFFEPEDSFVDKPCAWERLDVIGSIELESLACLPLAAIQSCAVHGRMSMPFYEKPDAVQAAISSISRAHHLVFQASSGNTECFWHPAEPSFEVKCWELHPQVLACVIPLVICHLAPSTVLVLSRLYTDPPEVQASLAAAPATVTTLCLLNPESNITNTGGAFVGLLAHMPHVTRLVFGSDTPRGLAAWLRWLSLLLTGVARQLRLTLVRPAFQVWLVSDQEEIRQLVAELISEHVHIEFQHTDANLDTY